MNTILDYLTIDILTMYENNIKNHFVEYVERYVNVVWKKKFIVSKIRKQNITKKEKDAKIKGQVYCNGNFEIKGTVSGSVYTKQFVANQSGSIFMNHIYNATIENQNIPMMYGGILLEQEPKTVLQWLY